MELEVEGLTGAPCGEKTPERLAQRNGYRDRIWETRAGTVELHIPKLRKGTAQTRAPRPARRQAGDLRRTRGIKAAIVKVLNATWQRCRVHFMRNALAHGGRNGRRVVSAFIAIADQLRPKLPKLSSFLDEAETDVLAYMTFPTTHRAKLHSTNPLERLNGEIKRRTEVVGIFPNEDAIVRLVGAILLEQNPEWAVQRARYMTLETPIRDDPAVSLSGNR
jgi:transposase-like protein